MKKEGGNFFWTFDIEKLRTTIVKVHKLLVKTITFDVQNSKIVLDD